MIFSNSRFKGIWLAAHPTAAEWDDKVLAAPDRCTGNGTQYQPCSPLLCS